LLIAQLLIDGHTSCCARGGRDWMRYGRAHSGSRAASTVKGTANGVGRFSVVAPTSPNSSSRAASSSSGSA